MQNYLYVIQFSTAKCIVFTFSSLYCYSYPYQYFCADVVMNLANSEEEEAKNWIWNCNTSVESAAICFVTWRMLLFSAVFEEDQSNHLWLINKRFLQSVKRDCCIEWYLFHFYFKNQYLKFINGGKKYVFWWTNVCCKKDLNTAQKSVSFLSILQFKNK